MVFVPLSRSFTLTMPSHSNLEDSALRLGSILTHAMVVSNGGQPRDVAHPGSIIGIRLCVVTASQAYQPHGSRLANRL